VGCIFAELVKGNPLFNGEQEIDIVTKIFQLLGTPKSVTGFPSYTPRNFNELFPTLDNIGIDLLSQMLSYDPLLRISARRALEHQFLN
jgi:serine/threonine protein kinase